MGTLTELHTAIWPRLADNCKHEQKHAADARSLWPQIAADMAQLRGAYQSDQEFGAALVLHGIEYNKDDRAAFIWMGSLKPAALEDAMARCERRSPQFFHREVKSWNDPWFTAEVSLPNETVPADSVPVEAVEIAPLAGESAHDANQEDKKTEMPIGKRTWDARSLLFSLGDDARLLQAILGKNAASAISPLMPKHNKFLRFIIDRMKTGSLQPKAFNSHVFHARQLIPTLDKTFVGEMEFSRKEGRPNAKAIALFMEHFDLMQRAAESGWTFSEFMRATRGLPTPKPATAAEVWAQQRPPELTAEGLPQTAILADGTELTPEPIFVCGVCLFPSESRKDLSYIDAYMHTHDCRDWVSHMSASNVQEVGMHLAHRGLQLGRQYKAIGSFLSALGTAIRAKGETMERELWFKLEPFKNRTTGK